MVVVVVVGVTWGSDSLSDSRMSNTDPCGVDPSDVDDLDDVAQDDDEDSNGCKSS